MKHDTTLNIKNHWLLNGLLEEIIDGLFLLCLKNKNNKLGLEEAADGI